MKKIRFEEALEEYYRKTILLELLDSMQWEVLSVL